MTLPDKVANLIETFDRNIDSYRRGQYNKGLLGLHQLSTQMLTQRPHRPDRFPKQLAASIQRATFDGSPNGQFAYTGTTTCR